MRTGKNLLVDRDPVPKIVAGNKSTPLHFCAAGRGGISLWRRESEKIRRSRKSILGAMNLRARNSPG